MLTIEKIEGKIVVIEDGDSSFEADISLFDGKVREGDIVARLSNGRYKKDNAATEKRRKEIINLQNSLWD
jgi:hypothetical protein